MDWQQDENQALRKKISQLYAQLIENSKQLKNPPFIYDDPHQPHPQPTVVETQSNHISSSN